MRHQVVRFGLTQAFLDSAFNSNQSGAELIFSQFTNGTDTTIAKVIDVVNFAAAVAQIHENLDDFDDVAWRQGQLFANLGICAKRLDFADQRFGIGQRHVFRHRTRSVRQEADQVLNRRKWETGTLGEVFQRCFST